MNSRPTRRLRHLGAGVSTGALVAASLLLVATPAQASSHDHTITPNLVDQTDTRSAGHNDFTDSGVHVYTDNDSSQAKAAGYFDVDQSLAYVGEPSMAWSTRSAIPGLQLVVDFDNNGTTDAILVGEPANHDDVDGQTVPDWWVPAGSSSQFVKDAAPRTDGGSGSAYHGTLDEWRHAFPHAKVFAVGWSLGSGVLGDGVIKSIALGDEVYLPRAGDAVSTHVLNKNAVDLSSTREHGHNVFQADGVHVYTDGNSDTTDNVNTDKAAGYFPVSAPLSSIGIPAMDVTNNAPSDSDSYVPGTQTEVDLDNDGTPDGILVGESSYAPLFWLSKDTVNGPGTTDTAILNAVPRKPGHDGAPGYSHGAGTMAEWNHAFPDAQVLQGGWSLGSGAKGDATIHSMTYGLDRFTFTNANVPPTADPVKASVQAGATVSIPLLGHDADGDPLAYSAAVSNGTGQIDGHTLTFTADDNHHGRVTFAYAVSDGTASAVNSTVTVNIGRADAHVAFTTTPVTPTHRQNVTVHVVVTSTGNMYRGVADVYDGTKLVGTGRIHTSGKQDIRLTSKLSKGTHTLRVKYRGTKYTNPKSHSMQIVVD